MNKILSHWFTALLILLWLVVCVVQQKTDLVSKFANKGFDILGNEYFRFGTALLLHKHPLHMALNSAAIYFVGKYLEPQINPAKLLIFSAVIGMITEILFSAVYRESVSFGGSPIVFALIGLIAALQIMKTDIYTFQLGNWMCNWITAYTLLANIPLFSNNFASTLLIHGIPFGIGILFGCIGTVLNLL